MVAYSVKWSVHCIPVGVSMITMPLLSIWSLIWECSVGSFQFSVPGRILAESFCPLTRGQPNELRGVLVRPPGIGCVSALCLLSGRSCLMTGTRGCNWLAGVRQSDSGLPAAASQLMLCIQPHDQYVGIPAVA